jgi:hypothetical protein
MKRLAYLSLFTLFCLTSGMICDDPSLKPDNSEQEVKDGEVKVFHGGKRPEKCLRERRNYSGIFQSF